MARIAAQDDGRLAGALIEDELVAHLLLLHGLHPMTLEHRVLDALAEVRPYLESHGGDVELLGIEGAVVRLRLRGSCNGCSSSTVTLKLAIEKAIAKRRPRSRTWSPRRRCRRCCRSSWRRWHRGRAPPGFGDGGADGAVRWRLIASTARSPRRACAASRSGGPSRRGAARALRAVRRADPSAATPAGPAQPRAAVRLPRVLAAVRPPSGG